MKITCKGRFRCRPSPNLGRCPGTDVPRLGWSAAYRGAPRRRRDIAAISARRFPSEGEDHRDGARPVQPNDPLNPLVRYGLTSAAAIFTKTPDTARILPRSMQRKSINFLELGLESARPSRPQGRPGAAAAFRRPAALLERGAPRDPSAGRTVARVLRRATHYRR